MSSPWKESEFQEILIDRSISYGIVQPGDHTEFHSVPIVRVNNIRDGRIDAHEVLKVDAQVEKKYTRTRLKGGELLITVVGTVGECAIVPDSLNGWNVARAVSVARLTDDADVRFIKYAFKTEDIVFQMYGGTNDTVQPTLNLSSLKTLRFKLPDIKEQRAIASVLSSLDDKIDLLHRQNRTLEAMAETLFRQWFVEEAGDDWEEVCISDVATLNASAMTNSHPHKIIRYLDTGSLTNGNFGDTQLLSLADAPSRARRLVKHNDILISTVRPDQRHYGIVKAPTEDLVVSTGFCVITANLVDPHFLYLLLTSEEMTEYLHTIAEGSTSTYPSLKPSDVGEIRFKKPPFPIHEQFARIASSVWDKMTMNSDQIRALEKLRDTLLPKLMSGEVRVANE